MTGILGHLSGVHTECCAYTHRFMLLCRDQNTFAQRAEAGEALETRGMMDVAQGNVAPWMKISGSLSP